MIIADNGSNMIKAFKQVHVNHIDEVIENVVTSNTEKETSDSGNLYSDYLDDINAQDSESDESRDEEDEPLVFPTSPNSQTEKSTILIENEEVEHDHFQTKVTDALAQCRGWVRRSNETR